MNNSVEVDCPRCTGIAADDLSNSVSHVRWAKDSKGQLPDPETQRRAVQELSSVCFACGDTKKVSSIYAMWIVLGKKLRCVREENDIGMREAAEHLGFMPSRYSMIESGMRAIPMRIYNAMLAEISDLQPLDRSSSLEKDNTTT